VSRDLALHPFHLTRDKEGNLPPSALVPFCSYQGESSLLGKELPEMDNLTVCDKFQPTILEGQLCHTLDIATLVDVPSKSGKSNGLRLYWIQILIIRTSRIRILGALKMAAKFPESSSTLSHNTLRLDLDHMQ